MRPVFSQDWFATPLEVLQADWQDVRHSPQPPLSPQSPPVFKVKICFM
jgi:hypothetical protein